jgi:WD40-like Beta Propeller Repeat
MSPTDQQIANFPGLRSRTSRVAWIGFLTLWPYGSLASRTLDFDANEVTQPGITSTPSGRSLIFDLLGHLFEVPVSGGAAKQLTFGPYYYGDPVISPDGKRVAFISNRDAGDDGNLYVLELSTGKIVQLTHEFQAGSQVWSPDGKAITFLCPLRREGISA